MANMTAQQVIESAYRKNGIMTTSSTQLANGLTDLQNMLSTWSADGLIVPSFVTENFTLTAAQSVYSIGDAGGEDLSTVRPNRVKSAFIRISNYDYPINVNMTRSEYLLIPDKTTQGRPRRLHYDPQYPSGSIKFDYAADTTYDFHLVSEKPLTNPTAQATTFSVPQEFNTAMILNLAIALSHDNDNSLPDTLIRDAERSLESIMANNMGERLEFSSGLKEFVVGFGNSGTMDINRGY